MSPDSHKIKQATNQTTTKKPESHRGDSKSSSISTPSKLHEKGIRLDWEILERSGGETMVGGRLAYFYRNWEKLTTDHWVLEAVSGYHLELLCTPHQRKWPKERGMDEERCQSLSREIEALIEKKAVTQVHQVRGTSSAQCSLTKRRRSMIDLRELNRYVVPHHFKMEGITAMKGLVQRDDWMVKLDMKDAYLSVPIYPPHRRFLRFQWRGKIWEFKSLPFELRSAPHAFTKLLKPIVALLRKLGIRCILYLDDMLIMSQSRVDLQSQLATAIDLLTGIHNQHQEECVQANTGDRVPGISNRFTTDVHGSPEAEVR